MKTLAAIVLLIGGLAIAGCGGDSSAQPAPAPEPTAKERAEVGTKEPTVEVPEEPPEDLVVEDLVVGTGEEAKEGDMLAVKYVAVYVTGEELESSWGTGPVFFRLGAGEVSEGWERGLRGMRIGGRRRLLIPTRLTSFVDPWFKGPPEESLVYVVDLVGIR